jgi:hypothetical protein
MNQQHQLQLLLAHLFERLIAKNTSIVYEDVDGTESGDGSLHNGSALRN